MKVQVSRVKIQKKPENRVTSHLIMKPHRRRKAKNLLFHEDGIFSKKIFGNLYRCDCGALYEEGFCEACQCRVVNPTNMPDFYIDLNPLNKLQRAPVRAMCAQLDKIHLSSHDVSSARTM